MSPIARRQLTYIRKRQPHTAHLGDPLLQCPAGKISVAGHQRQHIGGDLGRALRAALGWHHRGHARRLEASHHSPHGVAVHPERRRDLHIRGQARPRQRGHARRLGLLVVRRPDMDRRRAEQHRPLSPDSKSVNRFPIGRPGPQATSNNADCSPTPRTPQGYANPPPRGGQMHQQFSAPRSPAHKPDVQTSEIS